MKVKTALILCAGFGKRLNPKTIEKVLPSYIWRYRKGGQFG